MTAHCIHSDLLGECANPACPYHGACDGECHGYSDDDIDALEPSDIGGGDCCVYFEGERK